MLLGNTNLFKADNVLKTAQELQRTIAEAHPEAAPEIAQNALDVLGDTREVFGVNKVAIRTASGFVINRGLTRAEQVYGGVQYGDMDLTAFFSAITYVHVGRAINSLCLDLFDVTVLRPVEPDDPTEGRLQMPLLIPVFAVDNVWALN